MTESRKLRGHVFLLTMLYAAGAVLTGCSSTGDTSGGSAKSSAPTRQVPSKYIADEGRTIEIGRSSPTDGGLAFKEPHLTKCWIADGFDFKGYQLLYVAPSTSTAKVHDDEQRLLDWTKQTLPSELSGSV